MADSFDNHNRRIDYLRLSITDRCNLRCVYCLPPGGVKPKSHDEILSYEEIELFAKCAIESGLSKIRLTGGEPLVRKDVTHLVKNLCCIEGLKDVSLTTNGTLLGGYASSLSAAGLKRVNISLDSLDGEVYRRLTRGGDLRRVLAGLEKAIETGLRPVKVNVVTVRQLNQNFGAFAKLTFDLPVHVRFIEYMPVGKKSYWRTDDYIPGDEVKKILEKHSPLEPAESPTGWGPARYFQMKGALGKIGFINPRTTHFCSECNRLRLTADGRLRTCLFSEEEVEVKEFLRRGATKDEVKSLIKKALDSKPLSRPDFVQSGRTMSEIGG